jgi:SAM-dependent methyltransferase
VFLSAAAPNARILSIDVNNTLLPGIELTTRVDFLQTHILDYIAYENERFVVVFSNHVLEHMNDPVPVLAGLRRQLVRGGVMLAGLPLDGETCSAVLQHKLIRRLSATDLGEFDLSHPWKTTASDLYETLVAAGFDNVRLVQREHHLNFMTPGDETRLRKISARGKLLNRLIFGPIKQVINTCFGRWPPLLALQLLYGLERRVWFGSNNLKNRTTPEILVVATALS